MMKTTLIRVLGLAICFVLLAAAGFLSKIENPVSASQKGPDCKNVAATRDRVRAALRGQSVGAGFATFPALRVNVRDGKLRVEGKIDNSSDEELVKIIIHQLNDPCVSVSNVSMGLEINCPNDQAILNNIKVFLGYLRCSVSREITATIKDGTVTIDGSVPDERYKAYLAKLVESVDCVKPGVINKLVVSAPSPFPGNCSQLPGPVLQKNLEQELRSRMPCGVLDHVSLNVANGVITLTGAGLGAYRDRIIRIIKSLCPGFVTNRNLNIDWLAVEPSCPIGAKSCTTIDGEQYCCTGCKTCPTH